MSLQDVTLKSPISLRVANTLAYFAQPLLTKKEKFFVQLGFSSDGPEQTV
jgi:hypothetical protein